MAEGASSERLTSTISGASEATASGRKFGPDADESTLMYATAFDFNSSVGNGESAIISRQSGRALTVQGGRDNNGANIIQQSWRGSAQQRWRLEQIGGDYYRIVSVDNGRCLDVTEQGMQDGANIQLWDYANQANQQWRLRR